MKVKLFLALLIALSIMQIGLAQNKDLQSYSQNLFIATRQIDFIKSNGIFIRLRTYDRSIAKLKDIGAISDANALVKKEENLKNEILSAFKDQFDFCKVYFFYSRDMEKLQAGDFSTAMGIDGQGAQYNLKEFYFIDPYNAQIQTMNSSSTGFTVYDQHGALLQDPFPSVILKRWGPFFKTYPQLVFDFNYRFNELDHIRQNITKGTLQDLLSKHATTGQKGERRLINQELRTLQKYFKKSYPWNKRPKNSNKGY